MEGQLVHFELPAKDSGRAKKFWSSLFGWKYREYEGPVEYSMLDGNEPGGAIYPAQQVRIGFRRQKLRRVVHAGSHEL